MGECLEPQATAGNWLELARLRRPGEPDGRRRQPRSSRRLLSEEPGARLQSQGQNAQGWAQVGLPDTDPPHSSLSGPPPPGSFQSIDTCAGLAPAANIFLMSSQGLKPARSALQGGFSPGRCFGRRRCSEAPRGWGGVEATTNLSLRGAREEDFLLKFKTAAFSRGGGAKCISLRTMGFFSPRVSGTGGAGTHRIGPA